MPGPWCHRGGHGRRGGARPRRIRRFVEPALLLLLRGNPTHGYALAERMHELGLDAYPVDISVIYRILNDLEAKGMLVSHIDAEQTAGPPRRVYTLTEAGDAYLRSWVHELRETIRMLHRFLDAYDAHAQEHADSDRSPYHERDEE
ncbi:MAG TPA: PadR family transcriptional regulator [Chloroflexi bacterium]|jgi:PadR family transcriptional regulator PadR|nr:PadR family transcriptional regulator [Chloroflexota bacterium]